MLPVQAFLTANRSSVYFLYGLVFFLMGWSIWFQPRPASSLRLARSLPLLAVFAGIHGLAEWGHLFLPLKATYLSHYGIHSLHIVQQLLFAGSFLALFLFGCYLLADSRPRLTWLPLLPMVVFGYWSARFLIMEASACTDPQHSWALTVEIWGRYLLAFPGAIASAAGLYLQLAQFRETGFARVVPDLRGASITLIFYAFFAGVLVPRAEFFPANLLNREEFLRHLGMPVPIPRALCSILLSFYILRILRVFDAETRRRLETAEAARAAAEERERLGRELHDGILQSIYAAGLGLQATRRRMAAEPEAAARRVDTTIEQLGGVIEEIRAYISGLAPGDVRTPTLRERLDQAVRNFETTYGVPVEYQVEGLPERFPGAGLQENVVGILREALSNAGRHAGAALVRVTVTVSGNTLNLNVADDGQGFQLEAATALHGHYGLQILRRRAESMGGSLRITSIPGRGTQVEAALPIKKGDLTA